MGQEGYTSAYYTYLSPGSRRSAERILPEVVNRLGAANVVDFGCGSGAWLAAAQTLNLDILGLDGAWVPRETLEIDSKCFRTADLTKPLDLDREFDLALCLEVAEHLPAESAATLVDNIVRHAPAVVFSAAIPGQGGHDHVNEAWPDIWAKYFDRTGYDCLDVLRPMFWSDDSVEFWYRQSTLLFVRRGHDMAVRARAAKWPEQNGPLPLVHPEMVQHCLDTVMRLEREKQAAIDQILNTKSWRLTAPLRWLDRRFRSKGDA